MDHRFIWITDQLEPVIIIGTVTLGFLIHLLITSSKKIEGLLSKNNNNTSWVIFSRLTGFLFFGIIPFLMVSVVFNKPISDFGINTDNLTRSLLWFAGMVCIIIPVSYFATRNPDNLAMYPQIRKENWSPVLLFMSALTWIIYLIGYEFMFRGFLLFGLIPYFGIWTSIVLNLAFYSLMHIPKGMKETIGALPFGAIICLLTISTGTLWVAILAHMSLALSNEWFSLYYHPDMKLVRKK